LIHRAYHLYAVPTWDRKVRVLTGWCVSALFGRDIVSIEDEQHPRAAFVRAGIPERHKTFMFDESVPKEMADTA
jgi:NADH dehydrogenase